MINFRYHVVSLTAVFLALAIGLVVGTAALNGPAADALQERITAMTKSNQQYRDQIASMQEEASRKDDFVSESAPYLLGGKLTGRRVLVVTFPAGRDYTKGVSTELTAAGAKITGTVNLNDKFFDPENASELQELAEKSLPASVPATTLPSNSDVVETASALLAAVLMDRTPAVGANDMNTVLSAFTKSSYLSVDGKVSGPAEAVVVVSGMPYTDSAASQKNTNVQTTVVQFDKAGPIVVAGVLGGDGNVIAGVRADPALVKTVSTVDDASTMQGQVVAALAGWEQLVGGKSGQYGVGSGATSLMPKQPA
ncbi:copper transporter [Hamadaea tsunoensis]|uniref:copper transporter n=1 Tax=Hamadaea tsunoensis TaxID=53368 RepID=UPI00041C0490|nr:copper transporter [Hamadaea tsunoensis]